MHVLITRPQADGEKLAAKIENLGHRTSLFPVITIRSHILPSDYQLHPQTGLIFTSANGVRAFMAQAQARQHARDVPVFAIGAASAAACAAAGFRHVLRGDGTMPEFIDIICRTMSDANTHTASAKSRPLLHISGRDRAGDLAKILAARGIVVERLTLYQAVAAKHLPPDIADLLRANMIDALVFYSKRSARIFCELIEAAGLTSYCQSMRIFCLAESITQFMQAAGFHQCVSAARPEEKALLELFA